MHRVQTVDELVDLLLHRVEIEARAVRRRYAELLHQRLAAMVPGTDRDALHVENLRDIVRMDAVDVERHDAGTARGGRPVQRDAGDLAEPAEGVRGELVL